MSSIPELTESEMRLATSRAIGEYTINSALEWIARFHTQFPAPLITRLVNGVRILSKAMRGRSDIDIQGAIDSLLEIQKSLSLVGLQSKAPPSDPSHALPVTEAPPRVYDDWNLRIPFAPEAHLERNQSQRLGSVFISYARADSTWLKRLLVHLRPLERAGKVDIWHDGKIQTGNDWRLEIDNALLSASSAILLLTANFMASDFIYEHELPPILERARSKGVVLFPVVFGHCLFDEDTDLRDLQLFNDPERPLSRMDDAEADATLVKLAKSIAAFGPKLRPNV